MSNEINSDSFLTTLYPWTDNKTSMNYSMNYEDAYGDEYGNNGSTDDKLSGLPDILLRYDAFHLAIHGYLAILVIFFGSIGNIVTIIVFTRKSMITSINAILTGLAFADLMILLCYLSKIKYHSELAFMSHTDFNFSVASVNLFAQNSFIMFHTISVWLTVVVALWRVMTLCYPMPTMKWRSLFRARIAIVITCIASALICIPEYLRQEIGYADDRYEPEPSEIYIKNQSFFDSFDDWVFNLFLYLIPSILLLIFTSTLILKIYSVKKKRNSQIGSSDLDARDDKVSKILIVVLVIFLITKVPPGIMYILDFGFGNKYVHQIHYVFSGTINILILVNSAINYIVYFAMSNQFRQTAKTVFFQKIAENVPLIPMKELNKKDKEDYTEATVTEHDFCD